MAVLKAKATEALGINLLQMPVTVLSEKEMSDSSTLQEQCGTDSGLVQVNAILQHIVSTYEYPENKIDLCWLTHSSYLCNVHRSLEKAWPTSEST